MRNVKSLTLACCVAGLLGSSGAALAANMTTTNVVGSSTGWNTSNIWKTNNTGAATTGVFPGNTYECLFNGNVFGDNKQNTRMRNLYASTSPTYQVFPGDSLTMNTNTEFRFKRLTTVNTVPTVEFPGTNGNPGLILNGGVLNTGDDGVYPIAGTIYAVPGTLSMLALGDNGAGSTVRNSRSFNITGQLSGSGTIVIFQSPGVNPQLISGTSNTFTGQWIVQAGFLRGVGTNSLGTGNITLDPGYAVPLDPAGGVTLFNGPSILEFMYDHNSPGTLTIANGGQVRLHQNVAFASVIIDGAPLSAGTHYYADLAADHAANFPAGGSGTITVQPYGPLPVIFGQLPPPLVKIYAGGTVHITATASGPGTITYQWQKNGANLTDGGNISGATTPTLTLTDVSAADGASYKAVASNGTDTTTSTACNVQMVTPSGEPYEAAVLAAGPAVFYQLNETADPALKPPAFDFAGGGVGVYGTAVQNGFSTYNIAGPGAAWGFPGFAANNPAALFLQMNANSRITVPPWNLNTNTVTIAAWIKPTGAQMPNAGIVFCRGGGTVAGLNLSASTALGYNWNNEGETYTWDSAIIPPPDQWSLAALVIEPENATIYLMNTNGLLQSSHPYSHVNQAFGGTTLIGDDSNNTDGSRTFNGTIDDVSVFTRALSKSDLVALYTAALGAPASYPPVIAKSPDTLMLYVGQTARFHVVAGGTDPLTYKWFKGATQLTDGGKISGATTDTLVITGVDVADSEVYTVTVANALNSATSTGASLVVSLTSPPTHITMNTQEPGGSSWETGQYWSDGQPASVSSAMMPGSTYELLGGARMRSPENLRTTIFPGDVLTASGDSVWVNNPGSAVTNISEIRFKQPNPGRVIFKRLVMNGGQLDAGNDGIVEVGGQIDIRTNTPIYNDSGNDRGYLINAVLTGTGTVEYRGYNQGSFNAGYVNNLNIAGNSNTFSGEWNIVLGTLLATGTNCLGTNDIVIGDNGAFEPTYDINNTSGNLYLAGRMYLHQDHTFKSVFIKGVPLNVGKHTFAELNAAYPASFPATWTPQAGATNYTTGSGSITVLVQPAPTIVQEPADLSLYPTETAQFTVSVQGTPPLTYTWRKGGTALTDAGTVSGATTPTLAIANVGTADAGGYDVVIANSIGSVTSRVASLTIKPTGPALNLTLDYGGAPIVQATGLNWNTITNWSDGQPASVSALSNPGSTYRVVAGARLRSPEGADLSVFPGDVLTVDGDGLYANNGTPTIAEIRFKHANPGTNYFKRLVMNGGQLDSGDNGLLVIAGRMDVLANTPIYADSGAGQDRPYQIDAWLTGTGTIEYHAFNNSFTGNLNITGPSNTFSGEWNIVQGVLLGSAPGCLGTNKITIGATAALETLYNVYNPAGALVLDPAGQVFLHQDLAFRTVNIGGVDLAPGKYTFNALNTTYPANFPATWQQQMGSSFNAGSGSLTVLGDTPPDVTIQVKVTASGLELSWSEGTLLESVNLKDWTPVAGATSPFPVTPSPTVPQKFYKVQVR